MSQFPPSGQGNFAPNPYSGPQMPKPGQPMPPGTVKNWLVESIIALVCCAGVFAIPSIIYAAQVNSKLAAGDYQGAVDSSNSAKKWLIIAVCISLACGVLGLLIQLLIAIAASQAQ